MMNCINIIKIVFLLFVFFVSANVSFGQSINLEDIKKTLIENPPNNGDWFKRQQAVLALDTILKNDSCRTSEYMKIYYSEMMLKVNHEMKDLEGLASVWTMYNHGYIIKTQELTFAFDLVPGYWNSGLFPTDITAQIDVLFISHSHGDHYSSVIAKQIKEQGGTIVVPAAISYYGTLSMAFGDTISVSGLKIKLHEGLHSIPNAIFEVTTSHGIKFLHTGDNQTSSMLPEISGVDVLLLNAWVNESGLTSAILGMENSLNKIKPVLMIPGHIQELGHSYNPGSKATRVPYEWIFDVENIPFATEILVMAWGEKFDLPKNMTTNNNGQEIKNNQQIYTLSQNYPNPFNPITNIEYRISKSEFVTLNIYNILGKEIMTLVSKNLNPGNHTCQFDGRNLACGVYYYQLVAGDFRKVRKMILLR